MSDKKGKKRSKSYYLKCAAGGKKFKKVNDLAAGMKGFLVTCNKYERETVREMYNLLNEYADQIYGPEMKAKDIGDSENESEEEDMEKAIAKEATAMKEANNKEKRFQNTDTKTKNCIFIRTTVEDPCKVAHQIFTDIVEKQVQKARYALRMLPISVTCKANVTNIKEAAEIMLKPHFETEFGVGLKYTSVCKIRNNQSVSRTAILPTLGKIIQELNPLHRLSHDDPDLVIIIEVIRNVCCMGVVKDYFNFRKYNLHEVLVKKEVSDGVEKQADSKVEKETKEPNGKAGSESVDDLKDAKETGAVPSNNDDNDCGDGEIQTGSVPTKDETETKEKDVSKSDDDLGAVTEKGSVASNNVDDVKKEETIDEENK